MSGKVLEQIENKSKECYLTVKEANKALKDLPIKEVTSEELDRVGESFFKPKDSEIATLADIEKEHIVRVLRHFEGNKTKTAKALGITIKTLYNKLHQYGEFERFAIRNKDKK